MKKLSETYKELGIAFKFPIKIKDSKGKETYFENSNGFWYKNEYDSNGKVTYHEKSDGYWCKCEYDSDGNDTYHEDSSGYWCRKEYDSDGNETYYETSKGFWYKKEYNPDGEVTYHENSYGNKEGTPRSTKTCECGGNLVFRDAVIEEQLKEQLDGYIYSYECDKCQMLHFYKVKQ